ncbi:ACP S-malonyltransferase [bacterium]|jgi:[acyl-carrier-protein] S-malonyltransferase|nr:ACP S-malonyltransferase [bacterium]MDB4249729.1 ACP S-malonyltransferase [Acidimicrobiia bacterium]|tara:strand:- start:690 stop:1598 length:909 start_codon:yes stop_codon:yes gene_type:complete
MSWVGMFPGQGSQEPGMGMELLEKYPELLIDIFDDSLGWSLKDVINNGDAETIKKTNVAQPYIFAISYCYGLEAINKYGQASALLGHSLGEYTALAISGYFSFEDALKVISVRGEAMQKSVENSNTGMAAVLTTDLDATLNEIAVLNSQDIEVWISNYNDASQIVISSSIDNLEYLKSNAKALAARRVIPLEVAGAFHTETVSPAKPALAEALEKVQIQEGTIPVYMNVDANLATTETLKERLVDQIDSSVMFYDQILKIDTEIKPGEWVHIGPGNVTAGMVKKSISSKEIRVINSLESLSK